jgi:hypothetical protein
MNYNILEARIEFQKGQLHRITVLVDMTGDSSKPCTDVRAIFATATPRPGYMNLTPTHIVSVELLQEVAGYGMETVDRNEIFPNWKKKYPIA